MQPAVLRVSSNIQLKNYKEPRQTNKTNQTNKQTNKPAISIQQQRAPPPLLLPVLPYVSTVGVFLFVLQITMPTSVGSLPPPPSRPPKEKVKKKKKKSNSLSVFYGLEWAPERKEKGEKGGKGVRQHESVELHRECRNAIKGERAREGVVCAWRMVPEMSRCTSLQAPPSSAKEYELTIVF